MTLNINFDHNWCCCRNTIIDCDDIAVMNATDHLDWSPVELPHVIVVGRERIISNRLEKWWYRKQFHWIVSDQQSIQSVCLTFKLPNSDNKLIDDSIVLPVSVVVWLNKEKIFSGSLKVPQISIDFPQTLLNSQPMDSYKYKHTLVVCCLNTCLSFNAVITVPYEAVFSVRDVDLNTIVENTTNSSSEHNSICNDVAPFDGIDGCGHIVSDSMADKTFKEVIRAERTSTHNHSEEANHTFVPLLTIVMLIVGSRGDVEPFIAYGKALRAVGHRVRLATHEKFRKFVRNNNLEFFPLGGDPAEIMSFMVKNSGIIPSISTVVKGDVFRRRRIFSDILSSTWLACTNDDDETGASFRAEAIIANPISYGHVHCAQKLGVPLHMVFTMPYSPTMSFPHPLANVDYSKAPRERLNVFSYSLVEILMWLGIGGLINQFRRTTLDLPSLHIRQATSMMIDEKIPYTYCWSPSLVPKPPDWPFYINVSGNFFLNLASTYTTPPKDLLLFLGLSSESKTDKKDISPPIFIGFGSITGHDSQRLLDVVLKSLIQTGYRALLSGFDIDTDHLPETIFKIDDIPYDWLFQHVSAVCHHGGAGTTATGLRAGKPTITVPFFGDQFFWGNVVEKTGAGPPPLPGKDVTVEELVEAFKFAHKPITQAAAKRVQEAMSHEDGCAAAVRAFHANLPVSQMYSDLEPTYAACFRLDEFNLQVSRPVAQVLLSAGVVNESQFRYHSTRDWQVTHEKTSKSGVHDRPCIDDFQISTTNVGSSTPYGLKNDINNFTNKSRASCRHRRNSSTLVGMLIANVDNVMKPINGALLSGAKLNQSKSTSATTISSKYTDIKKSTTITNTLDRTSSSTSNNNDNQQQHSSDDITVLARNAANISGYSPEVCKHILLEFAKVKKHCVHMPTFSSMKHHQPHLFTVRRSRSFADL